jgi:Family of unknown function (DUF6364)
MDTKLTVRVPRRLLEKAKLYASRHNTTLTQLISAYLDRIPVESEPLDSAPNVRELSGVMTKAASVDDYKKHLEEKYGR